MQRAKTPSSSEDGLEVMEEKQVAGGQSQRWCWAVSFADSSGGKAGEGNGKPVFLPGAWWATSPWSRKESDTTE